MSTYVVESREAAAALARGRGTHILAPYFDAPTSVAGAARALGEPLARVYYWTRRWHDLGVLTVAEVVPRKGRPINLYKTVAEIVEVPPQLLPTALFEAQVARDSRVLVAGLNAAVPEIFFGGVLRVHRPAGQRYVSTDRTMPEGTPRRHDVLQTTFSVALDREEAAGLRTELEQLRDRWLQPSDRPGRATHLVVLAIAPLPPGEI